MKLSCCDLTNKQGCSHLPKPNSMKTAIFLFTAIILSSALFGQYRWKTIVPITDTTRICELRIQRWECTGCLHVTVMSGEIKVSRYWEGDSQFDGTGTALVLPQAAYRVLFGTTWESSKVLNEYLVRGRIIGIVPPGSKGVGSGYIFDVYEYKLLGKSDYNIEGEEDSTNYH